MAVKTQEGEATTMGPLKTIATEGIAHMYPLVILQVDVDIIIAKIRIGPTMAGETTMEAMIGAVIVTGVAILDPVTTADRWDT